MGAAAAREWPIVTAKVAINGFGRIGRNVLRALAERGRDDIKVVAINDLAPPATNAHLFRYDSVHGRFPGEAEARGRHAADPHAAGKSLARSRCWPSATSPSCPGATSASTSSWSAPASSPARRRRRAISERGAKQVLVSAPADGADLTVVYRRQPGPAAAEHTVVSNASCTTNCLAPVAKVLNDAVGIERGHMTTIHSFTNDQNLLDVFHKDLYRARAATMSMIPTSTGAAKAVGLVLPELKGKLDGVAIRVPTPNVSLVDLTFVPKRETIAEEINAALKAAAAGPLKGVLAYRGALVSIDFNHNPAARRSTSRPSR